MHRFPTVIGISIACLVLVCASALAAPPAITGLTGQTSFSAGDQADIQAYAEYWCEMMTNPGEDTLAEVSTARRRLVEPIRLSTTQFRIGYSSALVPLLEQIVKADNQYAAVNALTVLQELGTDRALEALIPFCDRATEKRMPIRLTASRACRRLFNADDVNSIRVKGALSSLVIAAEHEDDGLVLRRQLEALLSVGTPEARESLADALGIVLKRLDQASTPPDPQTVAALDSLLPKLRHTYLNLPGPQQQVFGRQLAGPLVDTLGLAQAQWEKAREDQPQNQVQLQSLYASIVLVSEQILKRIDPRVRPSEQAPDTDLHQAWQDSDRERFEADWRRWKSVVRTPGYRSS